MKREMSKKYSAVQLICDLSEDFRVTVSFFSDFYVIKEEQRIKERDWEWYWNEIYIAFYESGEIIEDS